MKVEEELNKNSKDEKSDTGIESDTEFHLAIAKSLTQLCIY